MLTYRIYQDDDIVESPRDWGNDNVIVGINSICDVEVESLYAALEHIDSNLKIDLLNSLDDYTLREVLDLPNYDRVETIQMIADNYSIDEIATEDQLLSFLKEEGYNILPVYMYNHSGICISTTPFSCKWDSGQIGYIYSREDTDDILKADIGLYSSYLEGDVYCYDILDADNDVVDSCCGIYGYEEAEKEAKSCI